MVGQPFLRPLGAGGSLGSGNLLSVICLEPIESRSWPPATSLLPRVYRLEGELSRVPKYTQEERRQIADEVRRARKRTGLSQEKFAKRLEAYGGLAVSRWERAVCVPKDDTLARIREEAARAGLPQVVPIEPPAPRSGDAPLSARLDAIEARIAALGQTLARLVQRASQAGTIIRSIGDVGQATDLLHQRAARLDEPGSLEAADTPEPQLDHDRESAQGEAGESGKRAGKSRGRRAASP